VGDCFGSDSTVRNYVVQHSSTGSDGLDNLLFSLSNSTFHDFKLCCGSIWILFKSIF
jgi:hypothetical protein